MINDHEKRLAEKRRLMATRYEERQAAKRHGQERADEIWETAAALNRRSTPYVVGFLLFCLLLMVLWVVFLVAIGEIPRP